ncbi:MAG: T9SS type A sorting domain-containing protein [Bacteroidales bacterium]
MKKITLFMMALIITFGAMAQFRTLNSVQSKESVFEYAKHHKLPATSYNNGAKTANATIAIVSNDGLTVTATVTPNTDCNSYFAVVAETGVVEAVASYYGVSEAMVVAAYGDPYAGVQTVTLAGATPNNTSNTVYVCAIGTADSAVVKSDYTSNYIGGTGTANVVTSVTNVTTNSADVDFAINDQTSYFYYIIGEQAAFVQNNMTTDADIIAYLVSEDSPSYQSMTGTVGSADDPLTNATEYVVYAFAYNQNDVLGTYTSGIHFITGQGVINGLNDVEGLSSSSVYPNPAKDNVNIASKANIEKVEMFNMMGQKVSENSVNSMFTSVNVANLNAGTYVVKVYTNAGLATKKIVVE